MMDGRYPGTMTHTGGMHVKRIPQLWPLLGLVLLPWGAGAAPLTLHDCLALAAGRQADILTGRDNVTSAQAHAVEAHSSYLPQVTVGTAKELVTAGNPLVNTDLSTDLTVTQMIFDGGQRELTYKSAKSAVTQSQAVLLRTQETVNFTITKDYLALLRAQALAKVSAQQTTYIEGQLKQVQARVEAGQAADVDALPIKAQLATDRRFHAQPTACSHCGPHYEYFVGQEMISDRIAVILKCISVSIENGEIVLIKGLGGMHLACDAFNESAVKKLRDLKNREGKPFAVMFRDLKSLREYGFFLAVRLYTPNVHEP